MLTLGRADRGALNVCHRPVAVLLAAILLVPGCVLTPKGAKEERARADKAGERYETKFEERKLPEIPDEPSWKDILARAFQADGELEAAYFRWKAALERIDAEGTWPNSDVNIGFETMFSGGSMKAWDRTTFSIGFDAMENLSFPTKTAQAAKVALAEARAAGENFRAVKFEVQRRVLFAWADYVQHAREIDTKRDEILLRRMMVEAGGISASAGGGQQMLVQADVMLRMAEIELDDLLAEHAAMRAMLNAWMQRDARSNLGVPRTVEPPRRIPADDAEMILLAAEEFPEVAKFAMEVEGRREILELARMRWIPDISPTASFTGSVAQALGAMITLPTTVTEIRARIREAEAELHAAESLLRQRKAERIGEYIGLLIALRRANDRAATLREIIEPAVQRLVESRQRAYEVGSVELKDILEAKTLLLNIRVLIARAEAIVEKSVVDIECCLGIDIETLLEKEHTNG
jgi:hypothetical protein